MASSVEKLVYLQNGVFKRKEMATGLQYYHNGAFKTFALPSGNGNFVLSNYNNDFTWVDAGSLESEEFTTLDNSYFKDSNSQAITIASQGTIPYFVNNNTFGKLDLPSSGKYVLNMDEDGVPSFSELNATGLFHDALGVQSTTLSLIAYKGNSAFGVNVPAMNSSSGYFVFKNEENTELPTTSVLTPTVIYQDILGCTSTERCLVYNDGSSVSKLDVPTTNGSYLLNVSSNGGVTLSPPPTKLATTFNYEWTGSGHSVVAETLTSTNTNLSSSITLSSNSKYLFTFDIGLKCTNYEQAFIGFTDDPYVTIGVKPTIGLRLYLNAASSTLHASGSCIVSPATTGALSISVARGGDTTISHIYSHFQVTIVEL